MFKLLIVFLFILKIKTENENNFKIRLMPKRKILDAQTVKSHDSINKERLCSMNPTSSLHRHSGRKKNFINKEVLVQNHETELNTFKKNSKHMRRHRCVTGQQQSEQNPKGSRLNYKYSQEKGTTPTFFRKSKIFQIKQSTTAPLRRSVRIHKRNSFAQNPERKLKIKDVRFRKPMGQLKEEPYNSLGNAPAERNELDHHCDSDISKFKPDQHLDNRKALHLPWNKIPEKRETTKSCFDLEQADGAVTLIIALLDMDSLKEKPHYTQSTMKKKVLTRDPNEQVKQSTKKMTLLKKMKNIMGQSPDEKLSTQQAECKSQQQTTASDYCTTATTTKHSISSSSENLSPKFSKMTATNSSSSLHGSSTCESCSEAPKETDGAGGVVVMIAVGKDQAESIHQRINSSLVTYEVATGSINSIGHNVTNPSPASVKSTLQNTFVTLNNISTTGIEQSKYFSTAENTPKSKPNVDQTASSSATNSQSTVEIINVSLLANSESSISLLSTSDLKTVNSFSSQMTPSTSSEYPSSTLNVNQTAQSLCTSTIISDYISTFNSTTTQVGSKDTYFTEVATLNTMGLSTISKSEQTDRKLANIESRISTKLPGPANAEIKTENIEPLTICFTVCPKPTSSDVSNPGTSVPPTVLPGLHQDVQADESKRIDNSEAERAEMLKPTVQPEEAQGSKFSPPPVAVLSHEPELIDTLFNDAKSGASVGLCVTPGSLVKTGVKKEQHEKQPKHLAELFGHQAVNKSVQNVQSEEISPIDSEPKCKGQLFVEPSSTECQTGGSFSPGPFIDGFFNQSKVNEKSLADFSKLFAVLATKKCK